MKIFEEICCVVNDDVLLARVAVSAVVFFWESPSIAARMYAREFY
jgi:hypothetical protein